MRQRRGSGSKRNKQANEDTYLYLGVAKVVAQERKGYYEARYRQYESNHTCHYA